MSHSNSSLNCFANCMAKYNFNYILRTPPDKPLSPHFAFGTMAHEVLYKAGKLRDENNDGVVDKEQYVQIIPSEVLYNDLKEAFNINNWEKYFVPIIKKTAEYETKLCKEFANDYGSYTIERELKMSMTPEQFKQVTGITIDQSIVGIIDCLIVQEGKAAIILDYKFSTKRKTQDDFDMNSQLPLYAFFVHHLYNVPLRNIKYGYVDIPKQMFDTPILLSNGTLSRSKSQNVSQDMYKKSVEAIHGQDEYYNCDEGGYYYDCYCNLALNQVAYLSIQYLDEDTYNGVLKDLFEAAYLVDKIKQENLPYLKKYDSYSCKSCEYLHSCKPWLNVGDGWQ